jgi:hypothetical protein
MPEVLATFLGPVSCTRAAGIPGLTLTGRTTESPDEDTAVAFSAPAPADLPETLPDVVVERVSETQWRISSAARVWLVSGAVQVHAEIAAQFYRAIPPRPAPWIKRLMWRLVLALAASRAGIALLQSLRR